MLRGIGLRIKRAFDVGASAFALLAASPLLLAVAIVLTLRQGPPVLFKQPRIGLNGREFDLYKFRTMTNKRDALGELLSDDQRITAIGSLLRRTTLDELPEAFNVLRGEMSIVGPRPLRIEYRDLYSAEQWRRHDMRPGMAGPVLAKGRNTLSWDDKFALDVQYVDQWSPWLDAKIIAQTTINIFKRKGISADDHATMPWFGGSDAKRDAD